MRKVPIFAAMVVVCVWASLAIAGALEDFGREWEQGRALPDWEIYKEVYTNTFDRQIRFVKQVHDPDAVIAVYEASMLRDGQRVVERGVAAFYVKDGAVYYVEQVSLEGVDMALFGQGADVASTVIGVSGGLMVEANPLGWGILPLKIAALMESVERPLLECIAWRQGLSALGWGAAVWNIGVMIGLHPIAGVIAAIATGMNTSSRESALRECVIAKLAVENKHDDR